MVLEPLTLKDIQDATKRIGKLIPFSPLEQSLHCSEQGRNVFLKLENKQPTAHSFKIRGAINKLSQLTAEQCEKGIGAISSGNHGVAVCCAAKWMQLPSPEIIIPHNTPKAKVKLMQFLGGKVVFLGDDYDEAHEQGEAYLSKTGKTVIDAYFADRDIFAGQGSTMLEILAQCPTVDTVVVPIGGGGLIGGIATAAKLSNPNLRVVGVQTAACPAMVQSLRDDTCYTDYPSEDSYCSALVGGVGVRGFEICKQYVDDIVVVSESEIKQAFCHALLEENQLMEPSSATVLAAELFHREQVGGHNVALVVSGGNVDKEMIQLLLS